MVQKNIQAAGLGWLKSGGEEQGQGSRYGQEHVRYIYLRFQQLVQDAEEADGGSWVL